MKGKRTRKIIESNCSMCYEPMLVIQVSKTQKCDSCKNDIQNQIRKVNEYDRELMYLIE